MSTGSAADLASFLKRRKVLVSTSSSDRNSGSILVARSTNSSAVVTETVSRRRSIADDGNPSTSVNATPGLITSLIVTRCMSCDSEEVPADTGRSTIGVASSPHSDCVATARQPSRRSTTHIHWSSTEHRSHLIDVLRPECRGPSVTQYSRLQIRRLAARDDPIDGPPVRNVDLIGRRVISSNRGHEGCRRLSGALRSLLKIVVGTKEPRSSRSGLAL